MATIEEELKMIKTAHGRLFNQFKQLENDINSLIVDLNLSNINMSTKIKELQQQIDSYQIPSKPIEQFKNNCCYSSTITEIVSTQEVKWDNKDFLDLDVKLIGRPEQIFKIFISKKNSVEVGNKIRFTFNEEHNKLSKIKVI
jgi:hypothetical protein